MHDGHRLLRRSAVQHSGGRDRRYVRRDPGLLQDLERVRVNGHPIVELRTLNEVLCSPRLAMGQTQRFDVARALGSEGLDARTRVALPPTASNQEVLDRLLDEARRWQGVATSTVSLPDEQRVARIAVRSLSALLASMAPAAT